MDYFARDADINSKKAHTLFDYIIGLDKQFFSA